MARRELSSTLKNLKFMQRASLKEESSKKQQQEEQTLKPPDASMSGAPARRCIVIMEGDPHPGALRGRMSFQSFNPSIDKLNEEAANNCQNKSESISHASSGFSERDGSSGLESKDTSTELSENASDLDLKRKQPEVGTRTTTPQKLQKVARSDGGQTSSQNNSKGSFKKPKHGKLNFNVLRPPKANNS